MQPEAAINLLTHKAEGTAWREPETDEQFIEKGLETKAPSMRVQLGDLHEQGREFLPISNTQRCRRLLLRLLGLGATKTAEEAGIKQLRNRELHGGKKAIEPFEPELAIAFRKTRIEDQL